MPRSKKQGRGRQMGAWAGPAAETQEAEQSLKMTAMFQAAQHMPVANVAYTLPVLMPVQPMITRVESAGSDGSNGSAPCGSAPSTASSHSSALPWDLGNPVTHCQDQARERQLEMRLEESDPEDRRAGLAWIMLDPRNLALHPHGCRLVQKAFDVANSSDRSMLAAALIPHTVELYESLHGNHVLTKIIEVMPSPKLDLLRQLLEAKGATVVARHRLGCRVLERLIEHCTEAELRALLGPVLSSADDLSRHAYGNFVIQHLLEHGTPSVIDHILMRLMENLSYLAMHRTASHVVQKALDHGGEEWQRRMVDRLLDAKEHTFAQVACSRYGSYVAEQLAGMREPHGCRARLREALSMSEGELAASAFGRRVAEKFEIPLPECEHEETNVVVDEEEDHARTRS